MRKIATLTLTVVLAVWWFSKPSFADKRVALVIGNSAYEHTQPLRNPANDAQAMAVALKKIGFDTVEVRLNQKINQLRRSLQRFGRLARQADIALVFYAGHGMEFGGRNYLVPTDARITSDQDVDFETVPLDLLMRAVEPARKLRIIILDACRNNPLASKMTVSRGSTRSVGRGLARVEPSGDTLVAYSARAGSVAEDGDGANSPYTTSLINHIATPGLDIRVMFGRVRDSVRTQTNRRQEPFTYGSIGGSEFYLVPPQPVVKAQPPQSKPDVGQAALTYWNLIKDKDNPALFESFLKRYPKSFLSDLARVRLDEIKRQRARRQVAKRRAAEKKTAELTQARKLAALTAKKSDSKSVHATPLPGNEVELAYWDTIRNDSNPASFKAYLKRYPGGLFTDLARIKITAMKDKQRQSRMDAKTKKLASLQPASRQNRFNGKWFVVRKSPGCKRIKQSKFVIRIRNNRITWRKGTGKISTDGRFWFKTRIVNGRQASFSGRIKGNKGSGGMIGQIIGAPRSCSGTIKLTRR